MTEDLRSSQYLKQLEVEKQKISCAFEPIQNLLEERKSLLLDHVVNLEKEIKETRETDLARLSGKITHLGNLITEMERKLQQPANEFLQDIKGTLLRSEEKQEVCHTSDLTPFWEDRLILYSQKTSALERALKKCQAWCVNLAANKAEVTLDPDTSNAFLVLSNDQISVRCGEEEQDVPSNPGRFSLEPCVLGNNVFTSGHAWWEVHVIQGGEMWALGVAKDTVRRKGNFIPSPDQGIWAIGKPSSDSSPPYQLWAFTSPKPTPVSLKRNPRKIRVCLDYEEERVEFFDANTNHLIFAFPSASFSGQNLRPFFWVEPGACLRC
nr:tripartite motif-containing protein 15-like isoform X2 [Zootoca vivipara]